MFLSGPINGGLLNINKSAGFSSFQAVKIIRDILKVKKAGHCGTLDPMATGVLLVLFGKATTFSEIYMNSDKVYQAQARLGIKTDTGDVTGKVEEERAVPEITEEKINAAFAEYIGEIDQVTPIYSASKRQGRPLYKYARAGIAFTPPIRRVTITSIQLLNFDQDYVRFRVHCSRGTYIRRLAEDLGSSLGTLATLSELLREQSGPFCVADSLNLRDAMNLNKDALLKHAQSPDLGLRF